MNALFYFKFTKFIFLFQLFLTSIKSYTPGLRYAHTATLVDDRLYFIGGSQNEFFYLNNTYLFDGTDANWVNLTIKSNLKRYDFATSVTDKINLYIILEAK